MPKITSSIVAIALFLITTPTRAEDAPAPDKSDYTLVNPVPDDLMRSFAPDRPTKLNGPTTVDAGHFQYEADFVNWTYDRFNSSKVTSSAFVVADPTFKVGLSNSTDLEFAIAPFNVNISNDRESNMESTASGFGDMYTRIKFNLFGNDAGSTYALALVPYVKLPTASHLFGNQHWEGGGYAPFTIAMPQDWSITMQPEIDFVENATLDGTHINYQNAVSVSHPLVTKDLIAAVDLWSLTNGDEGNSNQYTADFSLAFTVGDNLQLDGGINVGLNKSAPDLQSYCGISQRF
jgi:hypothetical protein